MRAIKLFCFLVIGVFFAGCAQSSGGSLDSGLKSLKLVKIDIEAKKAFYVPAKAVLKGANSGQGPVSVSLGQKRLIQGILTLAENPAEIEVLAQRVKDRYGNDFSLQKNLAGTYKIAMSVDEKEVFAHEVFSSNINLPFQFTCDNASVSVKVSLNYSDRFGGRKAISQTSVSSTKTFSSMSSTSGTTMQGSASAQIKNSSTDDKALAVDEFSLEQKFDF